MLNINLLVGILIGVFIAIPITVLIFILKELKKDIKGFYEREKEYTKAIIDTMKVVTNLSSATKKELEDIRNSFPTPEEVAKEVLKVKIPLESLSPEEQEVYKKMTPKTNAVDTSYFG